MNLLIDVPPDNVEIEGREYEINSDFRTSILFEMLMMDDDVDTDTKMMQAVELYFGEYPSGENIADVLKAIMWFYQCGRTDKERTVDKPVRRPGENDDADHDELVEENKDEKVYSYDYDDEYIYAAFLEQYGVDLVDVPYLHWWKFRAMFKGLNSDCQFVKIMGYRATRITKNMSKTEKEYLRKMKKIHALPASEKEMQEHNTLADALINGGDVDKILGYATED